MTFFDQESVQVPPGRPKTVQDRPRPPSDLPGTSKMVPKLIENRFNYDRQRDRETETQRHRETETQRDRETETQRHRDRTER